MANESAAMAIIQASTFYDQDFANPSLIQTPSNSSPENHVYGGSPEKAAGKNFTVSNSSTVSSPSSTNSNGLGFQEGNSVITFKPNFAHVNGLFLTFDHTKIKPKMISEEDEYSMWAGDHHHDLHYMGSMNSAAGHGPPETFSSHHAAAEQWAWLNDQVESGGQEAANNKRPSTGGNLQALKKQCVSASNKKPKLKVAAECKDPQSVAAKNRRERISERLKTLQELVPNGSKVDLVTMLEKAISYVKFLQLQVKVLATDEFWPVQGGKAPDLSQVREAIDAILASQRDRSSTSK